MISIVFFVLSAQCEQRSFWNNYYTVLRTREYLADNGLADMVPQHKSLHPNNCITTSYYPFSYPLRNFVSLRFFASRSSCMRVAVLFVNAINTEQTVFKKHDKKVSRYYVITYPSPYMQLFSNSNQHTQQDHSYPGSPLFNRAILSIVISPETFLKFN